MQIAVLFTHGALQATKPHPVAEPESRVRRGQMDQTRDTGAKP